MLHPRFPEPFTHHQPLVRNVWRQDHNGFNRQDPGFIDHIVNRKAGIILVYPPSHANALLWVTGHCLRSRNYVNALVTGQQPELARLGVETVTQRCIAVLITLQLHVRAYQEEVTTTSHCVRAVRNTLDRFQLVGGVIHRVPELGARTASSKQFNRDKLLHHENYTRKHGQGRPRNSLLGRESELVRVTTAEGENHASDNQVRGIQRSEVPFLV